LQTLWQDRVIQGLIMYSYKTLETLKTSDVIVMFDDVLDYLKKALYYGSVANTRQFFYTISLAKGSLISLSESIDQSDHVAKNLYNLLHFILYTLEDIDNHEDIAALQDALDILKPLRDALAA
jgi:flagellin-specific chaperone FliS